MALTKQLADLITLLRGVLAAIFVWLGITQRADGMPLAVVLLIANWTGDSIDGALARQSGLIQQTWIGDHDLEIDMLISVGLMGFMVAAGLLSWQVASLYLILWLLIFWRYGSVRSLGMLFQAPIYGWFIWVALRHESQVGWWLIAWIVIAIIVTWPKFPKVIIPGFLGGMRDWLEKR